MPVLPWAGLLLAVAAKCATAFVREFRLEEAAWGEPPKIPSPCEAQWRVISKGLASNSSAKLAAGRGGAASPSVTRVKTHKSAHTKNPRTSATSAAPTRLLAALAQSRQTSRDRPRPTARASDSAFHRRSTWEKPSLLALES